MTQTEEVVWYILVGGAMMRQCHTCIGATAMDRVGNMPDVSQSACFQHYGLRWKQQQGRICYVIP